jgi:hypothetical protein
MHVRKSVLAAIALTILLLTASVAYMVGKASYGAGDVAPAPQAKALDRAVSQRQPNPSPLPVVENSKTEEAKVAPKSAQPEVGPKPFTASEQRLIDGWLKAMEMCRGSPDEETQQTWCPRYAAAQERLNKMDICYGHEDDSSAADYDIHRCRKGSYRD